MTHENGNYDWFDRQERAMRAWVDELARCPEADAQQLERVRDHCTWLGETRERVSPDARR